MGVFKKRPLSYLSTVLGNIVGQPRLGVKDEDYKIWIKVRIRLNIGHGTPDDVLSILMLLYESKPYLLMREHKPNDVVFTIFGLPKAPIKAMFNIVKSAVPTATRCHFIRADHAPAFRFSHTAFSQSHFADFFWKINMSFTWASGQNANIQELSGRLYRYHLEKYRR